MTSTTTAVSDIKIICPEHQIELEYDFWGSLANYYAGGNFNGLFCPEKDCNYKV